MEWARYEAGAAVTTVTRRPSVSIWRSDGGGRISEIWDGHPEIAVSLHLGVKWGDGAETDGGRERAAWVKEIFSYCSFRVCSGLRTHTHRYTLSLIDEAPSRPLFAAFTPWLWHNKSEVQTFSSSYTLQPEIWSRVEASPAALIPLFNHETTFLCQFLYSRESVASKRSSNPMKWPKRTMNILIYPKADVASSSVQSSAIVAP